MEAASERKRQSTLRRELQWVLQGPCARGTKSRERLERYEKLKAAQPPELEQSLGSIQAMSSRLGRKTVELTGVGRPLMGSGSSGTLTFSCRETTGWALSAATGQENPPC